MKLRAVIKKSFPDHKGIPGHQGGSLPKNASGGSTRSQEDEARHQAKLEKRRARRAARMRAREEHAPGMGGAPQPIVSTTEPISYTKNFNMYMADYQMEQGEYRPKQPIEVWIQTGTRPTNAYYGSARIHEPTYKKDVATSRDKILVWPGGKFLLKGGKGERLKISFAPPSDRSPFEHSYGLDPSRYVPGGVMTYLGRGR